MTARLLPLLLVAVLAPFAALAAPSAEDLLRQGLLEEEANRDLDKAAERYRAAIEAHERQRSVAATAWFRLGEVARKRNDKSAAAAAFRAVIERFPEQGDLARLSRENLAALGMQEEESPASPGLGAPAALAAADPEGAELERLKRLASGSPDLLDGADKDGWRPVHHAAAKGWGRVLGYLLENRADPQVRTVVGGLAPLHLAAMHGHLAAVQALLAAKVDVNATYDGGLAESAGFPFPVREDRAWLAGEWTALDLAIVHDRREVARALVAAGADIRRSGPLARGGEGRFGVWHYFDSDSEDRWTIAFTPLLLAIDLRRDELALALVKAGAPLTAAAGAGSPAPLHHAVLANPALVAPLLHVGADPKLGIPSFGVTPLHDAAFLGNTELAQRLLDAGADPKAADNRGRTPLHYAGSPAMVDLLVAKGSGPTATDKKSLTPFGFQATLQSEGVPAILEALLKHGDSGGDPQQLLKTASARALPVVLERIVYPKSRRADAVLVFNPWGDSRSFGTAEVRAWPEMPPPPVPEALAPWRRDGVDLQRGITRLRILRQHGEGPVETVAEMAFAGDPSPPAEWPALQWGDIIELEWAKGDGWRMTRLVPDFQPIAVQLRIERLLFPCRIASWVQSRLGYPSELIRGEFGPFFDLGRVAVWRKGLGKPIRVDLTDQSQPRPRLREGDVVDLPLPASVPAGIAERKECLVVAGHFSQTMSRPAGGLVAGLRGWQMSGRRVDWSAVRILRRRAGAVVAETVDLVRWLEALPPQNRWTAEEMGKRDVPLEPGDVVFLAALPENAEREFRAMENVGMRLENVSRSMPRPAGE